MIILLAFALLCAVPPPAQAADASMERVYTPEEARRSALLNNASLLSAEQDIVVAQQRVREAQLQFLPDIGLQASATRFNARYPFALRPELRSVLLFPSDEDNIYSGRAYFTQSLYEGGRFRNLLRLAQTALKQAKTNYEAVKMDVALNTTRVFYRLLAAQENHAAPAERLAAAQQLAQKGLAGWERVEAEAVVADLRGREAQARRELEAARLEFRKGLNLELDTPVRVTGALETKPVDLDVNKAIVWATELRPELQSETYKAQMDSIAVNLALGRRNPTVMLAGDYELTGQRFPLRQNNWDATIGLRIPFSYDFWTQLKQKRAEQRQGEIKRAEIHDQVRLEVRQAHENLVFWQQEWPVREQEFTRLRTLMAAAQSAPGGLPALRAQVAVLTVQERYLEAVREHILARAKLERAIGRQLQ